MGKIVGKKIEIRHNYKVDLKSNHIWQQRKEKLYFHTVIFIFIVNISSNIILKLFFL